MGLFKQDIIIFKTEIARRKEEVRKLIKEVEIQAEIESEDLSMEESGRYALFVTKIYFDKVLVAFNESVSECNALADRMEDGEADRWDTVVAVYLTKYQLGLFDEFGKALDSIVSEYGES